MAERLTMREVIEHCERTVIQAEMLRFTDTKQYMEHKQVREWLEELQHYKDLEEQGRMVILPDGMNLRKLLDILTEYSPGCPSDYNLTNRCELSCFECWLAALKGADK